MSREAGDDRQEETSTRTVLRLHQCTAIMPFGEIVEPPPPKSKMPVGELVKVFD